MANKKVSKLVDKVAMDRLMASAVPDTMKSVLSDLIQASIDTNSADTIVTLKWHDDTADLDAFVPVMTLRMVKKSILDAEEKARAAKEKKNPTKHATLKVG